MYQSTLTLRYSIYVRYTAPRTPCILCRVYRSVMSTDSFLNHTMLPLSICSELNNSVYIHWSKLPVWLWNWMNRHLQILSEINMLISSDGTYMKTILVQSVSAVSQPGEDHLSSCGTADRQLVLWAGQTKNTSIALMPYHTSHFGCGFSVTVTFTTLAFFCSLSLFFNL